MSDQQMANRLYDILKQKSIMGMGVNVGGKRAAKSSKRKSSGKAAASKNPWVKFLDSYAKSHGINYREALMDPNAKKQYQGKSRNSNTRSSVKTKSTSKKRGRPPGISSLYKQFEVKKRRCKKGTSSSLTTPYERRDGTFVKGYQRCLKKRGGYQFMDIDD